MNRSLQSLLLLMCVLSSHIYAQHLQPFNCHDDGAQCLCCIGCVTLGTLSIIGGVATPLVASVLIDPFAGPACIIGTVYGSFCGLMCCAAGCEITENKGSTRANQQLTIGVQTIPPIVYHMVSHHSEDDINP